MKKLRTTIILFYIVTSAISFGQEKASEEYLKEEWLRTNPDVIVYLPKGENDGDNEHFLVFEAPKSEELIAIWTQTIS